MSMEARIGTRVILGATVLFLILGMVGLGADRAHATENIQTFTVSESTTQAGGHPDVNIVGQWDSSLVKNGQFTPPSVPGACGCDDVKDQLIHFPPGFIGTPPSLPQCTLAQFGLNQCPPETQVGTITLFFQGTVPIYSLVPHPGEAALQGNYVPLSSSALFTILHARTGSDYGLEASSPDILHTLPIHAAINLHLWGVPADPSHDPYRFPTIKTVGICGQGTTDYTVPCYPPLHLQGIVPTPYLENPTSCGDPLSAGLDLTYYDGESAQASTAWPSTTGCDQLSFNPSLTALPTTQEADTASGLDVDLSVPQTQSPTVPAPSEIRDTVVTFPPGFSINPNAADGKTSCTDSQGAFGTEDGAQCPEGSKVGTLTLDSPALPGPIGGAIYLGKPLPGDTYRIFLTADGFSTHVKLAGSITPDPQTGQLVASFKDLPQSPFSDFNLHFFGSERGLLATPIQCGTYPVTTEFTPWDSALGTQSSTSYFTVNSGPNGTPCPPAHRPFDPQLRAGTLDNTAGVHSPFTLQLTRQDGEQNLTGLSLSTPPGFTATLKGIPYCPQAAIDQLSTANYSGLTEQASSACPAASQVGTVTTGSGAGTHPLYTSGKVYLAGPYKGAPLSLEAVVPAVSGPYDLGNVAVRTALDIDPQTAQVTAVSDPLPQILGGIPLRLRSILINLNRQNFTQNPTSCDPFTIDSTIFGDQGASASPSAHFQVANCADLPFAPKLTLRLKGPTTRNGHPALFSTLVAGFDNEANAKRVVVNLPSTEQLDLSHIHVGTVCTRSQFAAEQCPPVSALGQASAMTPLLDQPLSGNVYLVSTGHQLPDLVIALRGQVDIDLYGVISQPKGQGLRVDFQNIPDVFVSKFNLSIDGGKKGLIVNNTDICKHAAPAMAQIDAENGKSADQKVVLHAPCGKARHKRHLTRARVVR